MTAAAWALIAIAIALCAVLAVLRARRLADQALVRTADRSVIERQTSALRDRVPDVRCPGRKCMQAKDCATPAVCRVYFLGRSHADARKAATQ